MTRYTEQNLRSEAAEMVKTVRKETGCKAKLDRWELVLSNSVHTHLAVFVKVFANGSCVGTIQKNVAI